MKLYLSSFRLGDRADVLMEMAAGRVLGVVPNALDHVAEETRATWHAGALAEVRALGIGAETLDLQDYFGRTDALERRLREIGGVWVTGGNAFVLRQAMQLSGFDTLLPDGVGSGFVYAGYSAGVCVLAPSLDGLQHVDDPDACPYPGSQTVWEGLGVLDHLILPHYKSNHPESEAIDREVAYCRARGIPFRTLRDGEVIVVDTSAA
jgi:dipeptidase E